MRSRTEMPDEYEGPVPDEYFLLWVLIAQTKDAILKARERDYARFGISNERRAVLWDIQNNGGQAAPVDIARNLFRELHSVTELLKRMEKDGLITRREGAGRSKVEVKTKAERERLTSYLWKLRSRALQDLGVPEWKIKFPLHPDPGGA